MRDNQARKWSRVLASTRSIVFVSLLLATGSGGCAFFKSLAGTNTVDLAEADVKSMSVDLRKEQKTICPREQVQMAVFVDIMPESGKEMEHYETWEGRGNVNKNDRLEFGEFAFHSPQGEFDEEGWLTPNPDLLATVKTEFEITTAYKRRPDKFTFKMNYKPDYACIRSGGSMGEPGRPGMTGPAGQDGTEGASGSDTGPGGNGTDGSPGAAGGGGTAGGDGTRIDAFVTMVSTPFYDKLVALRLRGGVNDFLLFHAEQKVVINATGGAGGPGGNGGTGGGGGRGGSGNPGGNGGNGASGGNGGNGGNGGRGGSIELTFDPRFPDLAQLVQLDVTGGPGGPPGGAGGAGRAGSGGTARGQGTMGASGSDGTAGTMGAPGQAGAAGSATAREGDVAAEFTNLDGITVL